MSTLPQCGQAPPLSSCGLQLLSITFANLYMDEKCQRADCMSDVALITAAFPTECMYYRYPLYAEHITPLRAHCAALERATTTAPPPPVSSQPPPTAPATPRPTETPAPTSPTATTTTSAPPVTSATASGSGEAEAPQSPTPTAAMDAPAPLVVGSNGTSPASSRAPRSTPIPTRTTSAESALLGTAKDESKSVTPWVLTGIAAVGLLVAVVFLVLRRRRAVTKSSSAYEAQHSPTVAVDDTKSSRTTAATNGSTDSSCALTADLYQQVNDALDNDTQLAAWRLHAARLTDKRFLGRGSHAFVHLVELPDRTLVAAKRLLASHVSLQAIQQLIHEAHIVSTLQHRSIVPFLGVAWSSPLDFQLLFEFMAGGDLRAYLDANKPASSPVDSLGSPCEWTTRQLRMALSIAEGLAYAHSFNPPLVHRDLKSRNVLLTHDLDAKISDFGVSRFLSDDATMTTGVGTNRWLAPEVLAGGGTYTEQCDIYSFGVVLTELDTHEVPFARETNTSDDGATGKRRTELSLMRGIASGELRPALSASCPVAVRELATRCLAFDAAERPNALELSHRLRLIVSGR